MTSIGPVAVFFRVLHILSAITLLGGVMAWRFAAIPAESSLGLEPRLEVANSTASAWRPWVVGSILGLIASGTYNILHKTGATPLYHALFGLKILLALHVFAAAYLATRPNNARRARQLTGVFISGILIVIISGILRGITLR
jgi:hypothetical protein